MKTWRIAPTWCALLYWPKIYVALKDTGQNLNKRHIRSMQKLKFSGIPDTRNTRWFWKKIGSGSGIDKNFGFGPGIGYPLGPDLYLTPFGQLSHLRLPFWLLVFWPYGRRLRDTLSAHVGFSNCGRIMKPKQNFGWNDTQETLLQIRRNFNPFLWFLSDPGLLVRSMCLVVSH